MITEEEMQAWLDLSDKIAAHAHSILEELYRIRKLSTWDLKYLFFKGIEDNEVLFAGTDRYGDSVSFEFSVKYLTDPSWADAEKRKQEEREVQAQEAKERETEAVRKRELAMLATLQAKYSQS